MKDLPIKRNLKEENRIQDSRVGNPKDGTGVLISIYEQNGEPDNKSCDGFKEAVLKK